MNATTAQSGSQQQSPPVASFFAALRGSGFVRPPERMVAGVAGAVANRWGIDPILVRVGFVVLCLFGGLGLMAYGAGWLLIPDSQGRIHAEEALAGRFAPGAIGGALALLLGLFSLGPVWAVGDGPSIGGLIALASLVLVILILLHAFGVIGNDTQRAGGSITANETHSGERHSGGRVDLRKPSSPQGSAAWQRATPAAPVATTTRLPVGGPPSDPSIVDGTTTPPRPPRLPKPPRPQRRTPGPAGTALAAGLALVAAGVVVAARGDVPSGADLPAVAWGSALGVLALVLVALGLAGRRSGGVSWLAVIAALFAVGHSITAAGEEFYVDDVTWSPTSLSSSGTEYQLSSGQAVLDLTDLPAGSTGSTPFVDADVSIGELRVIVPADMTVELDAQVGLGDVTGASEGETRIGPAGPPDLSLRANVGIGALAIEEVAP